MTIKKLSMVGRQSSQQLKKPARNSVGRSRPAATLATNTQVAQQRGTETNDSLTARLPQGYAELLEDIKSRIQRAQVRAAVAASRELIRLYWDIGREIVQRQRREGWGAKVIDRLAGDLQKAFPGRGGFSRTNIHRARSFYLAYTEGLTIVPQLVEQLESQIVPQTGGQLSRPPVVVVDTPDGWNLPRSVAEIPWGHNAVLLEKLKDTAKRLWYAEKTIQNGWSRAVLMHQIELDLYAREGRAITNFQQTLPAPQSDLAQQTIKDPYVFDFLTHDVNARERELERGLLTHIRDFMLELGVGFAFVGSQYHLDVDAKDYYIDLLFYHLTLRSYVVIDLKTAEFKPEFAGKMNFYLSAIDDQLRHGDDQSSIGLILCKVRDKVTVEYALRDTKKPIGVSEYKLTAALPKELKSSLPTIEQLEEELKKAK